MNDKLTICQTQLIKTAGYTYVGYKSGKNQILITTLIADAFVNRESNDLNRIHFIDGNRENITSSNLKWISKKIRNQDDIKKDRKRIREDASSKKVNMKRTPEIHQAVIARTQFRYVTDLEGETWRDINGIDAYQVSNKGRCYSFKRYILLSSKGEKKYKHVTLVANDGESYTYLVHILVASLFIVNDDPINKLTVNHIDYNPSNNDVTNLEWATHSEQIIHSHKRPRKAKKGKSVLRVKNGCVVNEYLSIRHAELATEYSYKKIKKLIKSGTEDKKGFTYKFDDEDKEGEIWKDIPNTHNGAKISNHGRIWTTTCDNKSYGANTADGYKTASLVTENGYTYSRRIHCLVAAAFIPNPTNLPTVGHLNNVRDCNRVENLEWQDYSTQNKQLWTSGGNACKKSPLAQCDFATGKIISVYHGYDCADKVHNTDRTWSRIENETIVEGMLWRKLTDTEMEENPVVDCCGCKCVYSIFELYTLKKLSAPVEHE